ncbi:MAG: hypothetical protein D8B60_09770 [Moraxella sp.]|jgi:hypothetical protein|nr:MAG: hypothetical protein D8B60_09770 [Moraxella sp.]
MNLDDFNNTTSKEAYDEYVLARQRENMTFVENYETWILRMTELENLHIKNQKHIWENSEHNPVNYPDYENQDEATKQRWIMNGQDEYNQAQKELDLQIERLEALLRHPDDIELVQDN